MKINPLDLFIMFSAAWRLSSLVANEEGPFGMFERFRYYAVHLCLRNRFFAAFHFAKGLLCEWCNSIWIASAITLCWFLLGHGIIYILLIFAISTWVIVMKYVVRILEQVRAYMETIARIAKQQSAYPAVLEPSRKEFDYEQGQDWNRAPAAAPRT